jgi:parallel beta-helix repeat protein
MKKLLFILALFASVFAEAQTLYIPTKPDSLLIPVTIGGSVRKVYVTDLIKNKPQVYNVQTFGAKGDSATNNKTAFRNAMAVAGAAGGGVVYIPEGVYLVDSSLSIPSNVHIRGAGRKASRVIMKPLSVQMIFRFEPTTVDASISDLSVAYYTKPDRYTYQANFAIRMGGIRNIVERTETYNATCGIAVLGAEDCIVRDNWVHDTGADGVAGFSSAAPSRRVLITGNHTYNTGDDGISCNTYTGVSPIDGYTITNNSVKNSGSRGIAVWGATNVIISGNTTDSTYLAGIVVMCGSGFTLASSVNIFGNQVNNAGKWNYSTINAEGTAGIVVESTSSLTVSDVSVHDNQIYKSAGPYVLVWNKDNSSVLLSNISIKNNKCFGGNTTFVTSGSQGPGVYPGIYVNNTNNASIIGNEISDALHDGIYIGTSCTGNIKILENQVDRANTAAASNKAGISVNSGTVILRNNSVYDPNGSVTNAIFVNSALSGVIGAGTDNQLGGRAYSSTLAGPLGGNAGDIAMYSLRKIKTGYAGKAVNIRRSSDNTTQDIGFTAGGDFDVAAFSAFVGAGSGFVATWYDQSGFAKDATQATTTAQPQLLLSQINGLPAVFFDGTDDVLAVASSTTYFNALHSTTGSISIVASVGTAVDPNAVYYFMGNNGGSSASTGFRITYDDRASVPLNNAFVAQVSLGSSGNNVLVETNQNVITPQTWVILNQVFDVANATFAQRSQQYVNASALTQTNTAFATAVTSAATNSLQIGASGASTLFFRGSMAEVIINNTKESSTTVGTLRTNQNSYYAIY